MLVVLLTIGWDFLVLVLPPEIRKRVRLAGIKSDLSTFVNQDISYQAQNATEQEPEIHKLVLLVRPVLLAITSMVALAIPLPILEYVNLVRLALRTNGYRIRA